jgi:molybdopterin-guanine dinucleotide biosynthesis protein A
MMLARSQVALGILAGGRASRMDGADKAMARHRGERLVDRTLAALGAGYAQILFSYNRGDAPEGACPVPDLRADFPGPLAGIEALLAACAAPWLLSVPVDLDEIPADLFERLRDSARGGQGVRVRDAEGEQPLVALWPVKAALPAVAAALDAGDGAVHRVQSALGFAACELSPWRFGNLNSAADLQA